MKQMMLGKLQERKKSGCGTWRRLKLVTLEPTGQADETEMNWRKKSRNGLKQMTLRKMQEREEWIWDPERAQVSDVWNQLINL